MPTGLGTNDIEKTDDKKKLGNFLRVFSGLVLAAFDRSSKTINRHIVTTISSGSGAVFPVIDRAIASYLDAGETLTSTDVIKNGTIYVKIDGYLTASTRLFSIENTMNSFNIKPYYSKVLGEALAVAADRAILSEVVNMVLPEVATPFTNDLTVAAAKAAIIAKVGDRFNQKSALVLVPAVAGSSSSQALGKLILQGLAEAQEEFYKNYVPESERYFYISTTGYASLLSALLPTSANYASLINAETGTLTNIMGFEIIQVPFLGTLENGVGQAKTDSAGTVTPAKHSFTATNLKSDRIIGIFHHKGAVATVKLQGLKMEQGRIVEQLADQMVAYYAMGHGGLRPEAAGLMLFAKST